MPSFGKKRPSEYRKPDCKVLPDERRRLTRFRAVVLAGHITDELMQDWGAVDTGDTTGLQAGFAGLRLVDQFLSGDLLPPRTENQATWVEVYEQLPATAEQLVGRPTRIKLEDGRDAWEYNHLQFTAGSYTPGMVGTSTAPDDVTLFLQREEAPDDGCLRRIKRTYVEAGILSTDDHDSGNGTLLKKTIVSAKTVPSTPSGYILVGSPVQSPYGLPVYTYTFYKGTGETSRRTLRSQNGTTEDGAVGVTRIEIDYLTVPGAAEPTWASVSGHVKILVVTQQRDGHVLWSALYAKGAGLVLQRVSDGPLGLRRVTNVSLGTKIAPSGIELNDSEYREEAGYRVYITNAMQTAAGGADPAAIEKTVQRYLSFTYPGRAKAYSEEINGFTLLDVYQDPPVTAKVAATIKFTYVTSPVLGAPMPALWNPVQWACLRAQWMGLGPEPGNIVRALPGYRSVSATPVTETASGFAPSDLSVFGNTVYGGHDATIIVAGGPADPGGNDYTLDAWIEENPVFVKSDGTEYYRKTVITATIPAQSALPV